MSAGGVLRGAIYLPVGADFTTPVRLQGLVTAACEDVGLEGAQRARALSSARIKPLKDNEDNEDNGSAIADRAGSVVYI